MYKSTIKYLLIIVGLLILIYSKLYWLIVLILIYSFGFIITIKMIKKKADYRYFGLFKNLTLIFFVFLLTVSLRVLVFDIYKIPSGSMEPTLIRGDIVVMNKLVYGPHLPDNIKDIPWLNILFNIAQLDLNLWNNKRLNGYSNVKRNEVAIFYLDSIKNRLLIKRCVGIGGDTLINFNGEVWLNNEATSKIDSLACIRLETKNGIENNLKVHNNGNTQLIEYNVWRKKKELFPRGQNTLWTTNLYGPLIIPKKGMEIKLTDDNVNLYSETILKYEKCIITKLAGKFYVDGKVETKYIFKYNYSFFLGDNRENSLDSRFFGFIPFQNIIGRADLLFMPSESKFRNEGILNWIK